MKIRLQKIIAQSGIGSRRQAEQWIAEGRVRVNGQVVNQLGTLADASEDVIKVGNRRVPRAEAKQYILLNKPTGCVSTMKDEKGRPTVMEFLKKIDVRTFPVGRLDFNTQGALLFTNDGELSKKLLDPKYHVPRTYQVKVRGIPDDKTLGRLRKGIALNGEPTEPLEAAVSRVSGKNCFLTIKLFEGKNRHIKRICEIVNHPVIRLKRTHFAFLSVKGMEPGQYRHLLPKEVESLRQLVARAEHGSAMSKTG